MLTQTSSVFYFFLGGVILYWQIFVEMNQVRNELNEKLLEIKRLQNGLDRHENRDVDGTFERLKRVIASLEKENNNLKVVICYQCL